MTNMKQISRERTALYASGADFCKIFEEDMKNLHLLSFLLTADPEKAEQIFVSGLEDCATGNQVFREWARSWARRVVIKNAIRMITPKPRENGVLHPAAKKWASGRARPELPAEISAVLELPPFERFAFVMSVFEGYTDQDCALLLDCTRDSLIAARVRASRRIGGFAKVDRSGPAGTSSRSESLHDRRNAMEELAPPATLATPA